MQKVNKSVIINAPIKKVWDTMLSPDTYREWTSAFDPSSHYEGSWEQGEKIKFIGTDENGKQMGMFSEIVENRLHEYISIHHLGIINDGVEDMSPTISKDWGDALENYTFENVDGHTKLSIYLDISEEYKDMMDDMWDKALVKLKTLCE